MLAVFAIKQTLKPPSCPQQDLFKYKNMKKSQKINLKAPLPLYQSPTEKHIVPEQICASPSIPLFAYSAIIQKNIAF